MNDAQPMQGRIPDGRLSALVPREPRYLIQTVTDGAGNSISLTYLSSVCSVRFQKG